MTTRATDISVTVPVELAYDRVKLLLFRPFDLGKWFVIGFCAWLAQLGESGGFHSNFNFNSSDKNVDVRHGFERAKDYVLDNLNWVVPVAIAVMIFIFAFGMLLIWLNSRGKFMFLHCVALNKAEVGEPWRKFSREGNSLFWFRIVLGLVGMVVMLPLLALGSLVVYTMVIRGEPNIAGILMVVGLVLVFVAVAIVFALIRKFTTDFVVPIMFLRGKKCWECWKELFALLSANAGQFALYILFQIVLGIVIGAMIFAIVLMTCCCTIGCLLAIPYIGTVLLLPVLVFKRSYSLHYLAQYGREYDVFPSPTAPMSGVAPPVM